MGWVQRLELRASDSGLEYFVLYHSMSGGGGGGRIIPAAAGVGGKSASIPWWPSGALVQLFWVLRSLIK